MVRNIFFIYLMLFQVTFNYYIIYFLFTLKYSMQYTVCRRSWRQLWLFRCLACLQKEQMLNIP